MNPLPSICPKGINMLCTKREYVTTILCNQLKYNMLCTKREHETTILCNQLEYVTTIICYAPRENMDHYIMQPTTIWTDFNLLECFINYASFFFFGFYVL